MALSLTWYIARRSSNCEVNGWRTWLPLPVLKLFRKPEMDCPAILKMSRPETPGLGEGNEGGPSIDAPFSKTTQKTIRSGFLCMQHITGVGKRLYREYGSQGCSRIPVVVRRLVSRLFENQCQLPLQRCCFHPPFMSQQTVIF